jgi:cytoskeletal protein RodZ
MPTDRVSSDVGRKLREARERRGVSLRQIADATKISVSALEALERNDISRLPGGIFSRAFVRSYAVEVGLDPDDASRDFIAQFPQDSVITGHPTTTQVEDYQATESDRRAATTFVRLIALSVPIAAALLYFGIVGRRAALAPTSPPPEHELSAPRLPIEAPLPPASTASVATVGAREDLLTVVLSATRPCLVSATVDGQTKIERTLGAGEQYTFDVRRELVLTANDAAGVTLRINGVQAKPLGREGEAVTARLNASNYKSFLAP